MKIESVTIQGMHHIKNKTYNFQDLNYLHGPNGAGKSTVLNAIQLAILGYIPGTAKQTSAIFQHASAPEMKIKVIFDNGQVILRSWYKKGRSIESQLSGSFSEEEIQDLIKDLELPIFNFSELVGLTANKLKDWFINFLPSNSIDINWEAELRSCLKGIEIMDPKILESALDLLTDETDDKSLIERIQAFNATMKNNQSYFKSELQRSDSTIQSLIYYDEDGLVGDAEYLKGEIQKAQNQIQKLTADKETVIKANQILSANQHIQDQICNTRELLLSESEISALHQKHASIADVIATTQVYASELQFKLNDISAQIADRRAQIRSKESVIQGNGVCPYTSNPCESITTLAEKFKDEIATLQTEITGLEKDFNDTRTLAENSAQEVSKLRNEYQEIMDTLSRAETAERQIEQLNSMLQDVPELPAATDLNFYSSEILRLNQRISKIEANKQYNALVDKLTADKYRLENAIEIQKCWVKLTDPNGLQTKVMDAPFQNLATEMSKYLTIMFAEDVRCNFNLEQRANSFSFGILRDDKYIPYDLLSSGEKTMYALALMLCIVNKTSSPVKLLIVDDMLDHLDDSRADEVFNALQKIEDIQIIIAGVKNSDNANSYTIEITK